MAAPTQQQRHVTRNGHSNGNGNPALLSTESWHHEHNVPEQFYTGNTLTVFQAQAEAFSKGLVVVGEVVAWPYRQAGQNIVRSHSGIDTPIAAKCNN